MTDAELKFVKNAIDKEGFNYCFTSWSEFTKEVKDEEFHKRRKEFVDSYWSLFDYLYKQDKQEEPADAA